MFTTCCREHGCVNQLLISLVKTHRISSLLGCRCFQQRCSQRKCWLLLPLLSLARSRGARAHCGQCWSLNSDCLHGFWRPEEQTPPRSAPLRLLEEKQRSNKNSNENSSFECAVTPGSIRWMDGWMKVLCYGPLWDVSASYEVLGE